MLKTWQIDSLAQTQALGAEALALLTWPAMVYLEGDMGAGKTTLCQSIVAAAGYSASVTSPTYNLIHEYPINDYERVIYHLDLYRLNDPEELYYLGLDDLWAEDRLFLVEWPQQGGGALMRPDFLIRINHINQPGSEARTVQLFGI